MTLNPPRLGKEEVTDHTAPDVSSSCSSGAVQCGAGADLRNVIRHDGRSRYGDSDRKLEKELSSAPGP